MLASDLTEENFKVFAKQTMLSFHLERCRVIENFPPKTWRDIAYPPIRWKHLYSFADNGKRMDVWVNWDGRTRVECGGRIILRLPWPAGEILTAAEDRRKAVQSY